MTEAYNAMSGFTQKTRGLLLKTTYKLINIIAECTFSAH